MVSLERFKLCATKATGINLYGLFTKFIAFSTIICAAALDKLAPVVGIDLPINVALIWTAFLILYEIGSILENAQAFGLKIAWLQKWLRVFERDVGDLPDKGTMYNKKASILQVTKRRCSMD